MSDRLQKALLGTAVLLLTIAPRPARAVCSSAGGCPDLVPACCGATSCTLDGTIPVTQDGCALNFGGRDVTLSGALDAGEHAVTITAGSLHITGRLTATGSHGIIKVAPAPGGTLGRAGVPGLSLTDQGQIDLRGSNGATLIVAADGTVELRGGQGSLVSADATDPGGAGGTIDLTSRGESITVGMPLSLQGGQGSSDQGGLGGTLRLSAAKDLTFTQSATPVSVTGGFGAGSFDLEAGGTVAFQLGSKLQATGFPQTGGSGGDIAVTGGTIDAEGILDATGGTGGQDGIGGDGGLIAIEARRGPLTIRRPSQTGLGIAVDGAPGGDSGEVDLTTDSPLSGTIDMSAPVSAHGGTTSLSGSGGNISVDAASRLAVNASIDVSAVTGDAGEIDLNPNERNVDVVVNAKLDASAVSGGGVLIIGSSHDIRFTTKSSLKMNAVGIVAGSGGSGGEVTATARNDLTFDLDPAGLPVDASGSAALSGGTITLIAGRNLSIGRGTSLNADGGGLAGACGGTVTLMAGANDAGDPDRPGDLTIDGQVSANGNACSAPRTVPCDDTNDNGCSIIAEGCQVKITGGVDSTDTGGVPSANLVIGRKGITVSGALRATRSGGSNSAYSSTPPQTAGATINPLLGPCPQACTAGRVGSSCARDADCDSTPRAGDGRCTTGCVRRLCTGRDPTTRALVPPGCLVPCPMCGNGGAPEFPEQCDDGNTADCDGCDPHCRVPVNAGCGDGNACTTDTCDSVYGCQNDPLVDGSACDDGDLCTTGDTCQGGSCQKGVQVVCDDGNVCTTDSCVPAAGCLHEAISCDDHNPCTLGPDTCDSGSGCQHGALKDCGQGKVCDSTTPNGDCVQKPCSPDGANPACDDGNPCTQDVCESGFCKNTPLDGSACDDADLCNGHETCQGGVCAPGPPLPPDCDDGNPCTVDRVCDAATGCVGHNDATEGCMRCDHGESCDGNPCTTDTCLPEGICSHENRVGCCTVDQDCADQVCMQKSCDHGTNSCVYKPTPGVACGGGCQGPELAVRPGRCTASGECCDADDGMCPLQVDACPTDDDFCTDDICDPDVGCVHRAVRPPDCCHSDAECDDGNACTHDACQDARCTYDLVDPNCVPCAKDADCGGRCLGKACVGGVCMDAPPFCKPPRSACLVVDGQPVCGCKNSPECDDGNACNGKETCVTATGTCVAGTPLNCDDGNICTEDSCNPASGCVKTDPSGFAGTTTQLAAVEAAVGAAVPADLALSLSKVVRTKTATIRAKLTAAQAAVGSSAKREGRMLKAANKGLHGLATAIRNARKGRKPKISAPLADTLLGRLGCAGTAVQGLQADVAP